MSYHLRKDIFYNKSYQKTGQATVDFLAELLADEEVRKALTEEQIRERFDLGYHMKHVDTIFARIFG